MKVSDQIVEMLVAAGIKRIYAVTGDSLNQVNDAVRRNGKIQWIHVRHEEVGAFAAGAEAQLNGFACCAGSAGPGHVHLINGLYDANKSGASVIAIASTILTPEYGTEYFQGTNTIKLFDDCSVYNQVATTPAQLPRMLQAAMQHALSKNGVAVLGLPGDIESLDAVEPLSSTNVFRTSTVLYPTMDGLNEFAEHINKAKKITVFCGIGCRDAHEQIITLAEKIKAPVGYSFKGKMAVQYDNPYEIGMTGLLGLPAAYKSMTESDLLILLGTDFPYAEFLPKDCNIIQVDEKQERLGRRAKVSLGLAGHVKETLQNALPLIEERSDDSFLKEQLHFYEHVKKVTQFYVDHPGEKSIIHPELVASVINELATDDAIFTVDTGMCCVWGARYIMATGRREMLGSFNHGSMANAMPQAIGAALAQPHRQVIALCGDGGISMLMGDLATIVQYNLPVKLVIFNNRSLGMVKLEMEVAGIPDWQTDMTDIDYTAVAAAMGIHSYKVREPDDVRTTLMDAFSFDGPALINIYTDPNALAMPPKTEFHQMTGFVTSMTKMMFNGRMDEVVSIFKSNYKHIVEAIAP